MYYFRYFKLISYSQLCMSGLEDWVEDYMIRSGSRIETVFGVWAKYKGYTGFPSCISIYEHKRQCLDLISVCKISEQRTLRLAQSSDARPR